MDLRGGISSPMCSFFRREFCVPFVCLANLSLLFFPFYCLPTVCRHSAPFRPDLPPWLRPLGSYMVIDTPHGSETLTV